jgi:hypothetical protein
MNELVLIVEVVAMLAKALGTATAQIAGTEPR